MAKFFKDLTEPEEIEFRNMLMSLLIHIMPGDVEFLAVVMVTDDKVVHHVQNKMSNGVLPNALLEAGANIASRERT